MWCLGPLQEGASSAPPTLSSLLTFHHSQTNISVIVSTCREESLGEFVWYFLRVLSLDLGVLNLLSGGS